MIIYLKNFTKGLDDNFVSNYIPYLISKKLKGVWASKNTDKIDDYLNKMYGIDSRYVVDLVSENVETSWYGTTCQIGINTNIYDDKSNQRIESLMKLIDSGNTDVKGLNIFRETLMYINTYINQAYKLYIKLNTINKKEGN